MGRSGTVWPFSVLTLWQLCRMTRHKGSLSTSSAYPSSPPHRSELAPRQYLFATPVLTSSFSGKPQVVL